jgi:hypothetical protein
VGFESYFQDLLSERLRHPQDHLLTALAQAEGEGTRLSKFLWMSLWECNRAENTMETFQFRDFTHARIEGREYVPFESPI